MNLNLSSRLGRGGLASPEEDLLFTVDTSIDTSLNISVQGGIGTIDWGDGSAVTPIVINTYSYSHSYPPAEIFQVRVTANAPYVNLAGQQSLISVENVGVLGYVDFGSMFENCSNLVSFNAGNNVPEILGIQNMFKGCTSLSSANVKTFDTSRINNISSMFQNCNSLTTLDLSNWDTSNVGYNIETFRQCTALGTLLLPDNFVTSSAVQLSAMLYDCQSLQNLDVSTWDTSSVRSMNAIFVRCYGLTDIVGLETNISITGLNVTSGLANTANSVPNQGTDYDALLINWEANLPTSGLAQSPRFNLSKVTTTAGNNARISLINNHNWVVLDGGPL